MTRFPLLPATIALVIGACSADAPTAPQNGPSFAQPASVTPLDLAGEWQWTRQERLTFPPFAAAVIFGVVPEGQRTVATCHTTGTVTFSQDGTTFSGTELTTASTCTTQGGQVFAIDPAADIQGVIMGRASLHMTLEGPVPCLLHAVARDVTNGTAHMLAGGGRCIIPGHPQSPVPGFDPPPLGTEVITSWTAIRQ